MDSDKQNKKFADLIPCKQGGELLIKKLSEALSNQDEKDDLPYEEPTPKQERSCLIGALSCVTTLNPCIGSQIDKDVEQLRRDKQLTNNNQLEEDMDKYVSEKASSRFSTNLESRGPTQKSTKEVMLSETNKNFGSSVKISKQRGSLLERMQGSPMSSEKHSNQERMINKISKILDQNKFMTLSSAERQIIQAYILKCELPEDLRKELWLRGSGAKTLMYDNHGYYERLCKNIAQYPNPCFYQIELDLHRTFSSSETIYSHTSEEKMRKVLGAYIKRNPTVGYCQGLNFIVAILLNKLEEEEAFWVLCQIIECLLPVDYYTQMTGVIIDQRCFEELLKENIPDVYEHLERNSCKVETYITQWFVCLFANTLDFDMLFQVWDYLFLRGILAIFRVALAVFGFLHDEILEANDLGALFMILK